MYRDDTWVKAGRLPRQLLRSVEFVSQCETLAKTARGQAEAYESWAQHAAPWDALLARALHDMAASLQETARQAAALTQQAADFVRFEEEEAAGH